MALSRPNNPDAEALPPHNDGQASKRVSQSPVPANYPPGSLEFSAPLETSVPLEAPRTAHRAPSVQPVTAPMGRLPDHTESEQLKAELPLETQSSDRLHHSELTVAALKPDAVVGFQANASEFDGADQVVEQAIIPLLEERLVIDRHRRKVGEVVVRKEIETYIVEVPVRREKLIVEQVSPEYKQLAVVDLGQTKAPKSNLADTSTSLTASAKFISARAAIEFLEAIAAHSESDLTAVQIDIVLADNNLRAAYQQWLARQPKKADSSQNI